MASPKLAYFLGFVFYWTVWCLLVPVLLMTRVEIKSLVEPNSVFFKGKNIVNILCLTLPLLFAYVYAFPRVIHSATFQIIAASLFLAIINGTLEEFFWRGFYLKLLASDRRLYILISSIGFAIWHFAPQLIFSNKAPGGQYSFVAFAFLLGIAFSIVAYNTKSILLVTICHVLFDFSGLGGRIYFSQIANN